jgi:hypothetical protein
MLSEYKFIWEISFDVLQKFVGRLDESRRLVLLPVVRLRQLIESSKVTVLPKSGVNKVITNHAQALSIGMTEYEKAIAHQNLAKKVKHHSRRAEYYHFKANSDPDNESTHKSERDHHEEMADKYLAAMSGLYSSTSQPESGGG